MSDMSEEGVSRRRILARKAVHTELLNFCLGHSCCSSLQSWTIQVRVLYALRLTTPSKHHVL
jgi:hypothetical protein